MRVQGVLICCCRCFGFDKIAIEYSVIDNSGKNARRSGGYALAADDELKTLTKLDIFPCV